MNAPQSLPALPEPALERWQPLRVGVVELYHYDCEEFWFRDGHLLLRGNNGTGKSKVLSLTLPFLLDARLVSARVEPDGDRAKRMEWNLLMGGRYERRLGYAWIEFGRVAQDGAGERAARYLTLGCALHAVAGRARIDAWHFMSSQRVGRDLWLVTADRAVLGRDRLGDALGIHGQVFDTASDYRRAVDEHLFRLGEARYDALMDTLIQLRQPQLSKRPDEHNLSQALTHALPPLPQAVLEDVAEAMTQLEDYREQLAQFEALHGAVVRFGQRYRAYAQVQARRQARGLRQAQTEFDTASRTLHQARDELQAAQTRARELDQRCTDLDSQLRRDRAALEELRADPVMRDARRLHEAEQAAEARGRDAVEAHKRGADAQARLTREQAASARRGAHAQDTTARLQGRMSEARGLALDIGIAAGHDELCAALGGLAPPQPDALGRGLRELAQRRSEQIAVVQRRLREQAAHAQACELARSARNDRAEQFDLAQHAAREADSALEQAAAALLKLWRAYFPSLHWLHLPDIDAALEALGSWVETQDGENPARAALAEAVRLAQRELAEERAALNQQGARVRAETEDLEAERDRLAAGEDRVPPAPHTRATDARLGRPGAPLWQLVEFAEHVEERQRAGVEAALEGAGLLDAWVTPQGVLIDAGTQDTLLVPRARRTHSLAHWLAPAPGPLAAQHIEALLASIACTEAEDAQAEAWIAPDGRFRLGPLRGAWSKPAAEYIGYAARAAARQRRLSEIARRLAELAAEWTRLGEALERLAQRQRNLEAALREAPADEPLARAHIAFAAAEKQRRGAQTRLAEADGKLQQAEHAWARARDALAFDAQDLRLPDDAEALAALERRLADYREAAQGLVHAAQDQARAWRELAEQSEREQAAQVDAETRRAEARRSRFAADEALAKRDVLRETVGAAVAELEARLKGTADAVSECDKALDEARRELSAAEQQRAKAEQKLEDCTQTLDERSARRQEWVAHLHGFARTGLLEIATPELALPEAWTVDPALNVARRVEQTLAQVAAEDGDWTRVQNEVSRDYTALTQALAAQGEQALAETTDYGLIVHIVYANRPERPDVLERRLDAEIAERRQILTAREREVLENHLQREVAAQLQRLLQEAQRRVNTINAELDRRPTSTGVRFRLEWQVLPEGGKDGEGAPVGLAEARKRLLNRAADAWSEEDRRVVGAFLHNGIAAERARDATPGGALLEHLSRSLDYRQWHRFRVQRFQDGAWRPLSGPASSGERALGLTVPLFAAASSHYASCGSPQAPRLVLLDEAFAGIDDEARAHCMALIREFDLDFVMTSEREWGCYAELPGVSICHLVRREGVDAVYVSRWTWDGKMRREQPDPSRRVPQAADARA